MLAGSFRGQPVGGSVGQTALSVSAGARGRWAAIFSGIWMALILLAFTGVVGEVSMPTLAAVLVAAALSSLRTGQVLAIARTSRIAKIGVIATFVATLLLPVAAAVVLRLRGRALLGATSYVVLSDYSDRLAAAGWRLYLSGVGPEVLAQVRRNRTVEDGEVRVFEATSVVGEGSLHAYRAAQDWLA